MFSRKGSLKLSRTFCRQVTPFSTWHLGMWLQTTKVSGALSALVSLLRRCTEAGLSSPEVKEVLKRASLLAHCHQPIVAPYGATRPHLKQCLQQQAVQAPTLCGVEWRVDVVAATRAVQGLAEPLVMLHVHTQPGETPIGMASSKLSTSTSKEISRNSDEFPMDEHDKFDIEIKDEEIARKYPIDPTKGGKWMLFFSIKHMNEMWQKALRLYRAGELTGIISIMTSTAAASPRATKTGKGAIRFACGPSDDEDKVLTYGRNLVAKMGHYTDLGYIAYKTDQQTDRGTVATGATRNFHYRIFVPTQNPAIKKNKNDKNKIEIPSRTWSNVWLYEIEDDIALQYQLDLSKLCTWSLTFPKQSLDAEWVKACKLYRTNELTGISYLKASTAKPNPGRERDRSGVIIFFCGPSSDEKSMMEYGRNLVRKMCYCNNPFGNLRCKSKSSSGTLQILYEIDLVTC